MEIRLRRNYGFQLIFEAENVKVIEDVEERIYPLTEDGKTDFKKPPKRDIKKSEIDIFVSVLSDMMDYREAEYDSKDLIERLFEKLPPKTANELVKYLSKTYTEEE